MSDPAVHLPWSCRAQARLGAFLGAYHKKGSAGLYAVGAFLAIGLVWSFLYRSFTTYNKVTQHIRPSQWFWLFFSVVSDLFFLFVLSSIGLALLSPLVGQCSSSSQHVLLDVACATTLFFEHVGSFFAGLFVGILYTLFVLPGLIGFMLLVCGCFLALPASTPF